MVAQQPGVPGKDNDPKNMPLPVQMDGNKVKELEVILSEMETRLRGTITRILRPTLEQISSIDHRLKECQLRVDAHQAEIVTVDGLRTELLEVKDFSKVLQDEVQDTGNQVMRNERSTSDAILQLKLAQGKTDDVVAELRGEIIRLTREDSRILQETERLQAQAEEASRKQEMDLIDCHRRVAVTKAGFEEKLNDIVTQSESAREDVWSEDKGIPMLNRKIEDLASFVSPLTEVRRTLKKTGQDVDKMSAEHERFRQEYQESQVVFKDWCTQQVADREEMQGGFKLTCNTLIAHNAQLMKDIRHDYQEEVDNLRVMRKDIASTLTNAEDVVANVNRKLEAEARRVDELHRELSQDIEEILQKRKKDRVTFEADTHQFRNELAAEKEMHGRSRVKIDFMGRILGLLLEGSRMGCALEVQDFADRSAERWLTLESEKPAGPAEILKAKDLEKQRQRKEVPGRRDQDAQDALVDIRHSGVKRGCYLPGEVSFSGQSFDRRDLLILQNRLLHKAHQAYNEGPDGSAEQLPRQQPSDSSTSRRTLTYARRAPTSNRIVEESDVEVALQPSATGGGSAEALPSKKGYPETVKSPSERGSSAAGSIRQRPGSQGQPQAIGSRGTASGPLGETEPPPGQEPLKLPAIGQVARGADGAPKVAGSPPLSSRPGTGQWSRPGSKTAR